MLKIFAIDYYHIYNKGNSLINGGYNNNLCKTYNSLQT